MKLLIRTRPQKVENKTEILLFYLIKDVVNDKYMIKGIYLSRGRFKREGTYVHLWLIHVDV